MLTFENDYSTGAHPKIMEKLLETNMIPQAGYGNDDYSKSAIEKIKKDINIVKKQPYYPLICMI